MDSLVFLAIELGAAGATQPFLCWGGAALAIGRKAPVRSNLTRSLLSQSNLPHAELKDLLYEFVIKGFAVWVADVVFVDKFTRYTFVLGGDGEGDDALGTALDGLGEDFGQRTADEALQPRDLGAFGQAGVDPAGVECVDGDSRALELTGQHSGAHVHSELGLGVGAKHTPFFLEVDIVEMNVTQPLGG